MDNKDLEVSAKIKVLGYELTLQQALALHLNLSESLNISYGEQHQTPAFPFDLGSAAHLDYLRMFGGYSDIKGPADAGSLNGGLAQFTDPVDKSKTVDKIDIGSRAPYAGAPGEMR